ncbi:MAG: ATP-dependent DNA helicase RecG [Gammaproteobacteria bacterium]|nr:ATP-dependent DNA helicase RecG [Gammaproteobacteria bacterium]
MKRLSLSDPVTAFKGVGPQLAQRLERLRMFTVQDVLFHLPLRYQDRTRVVPIGGLQAGIDAVIEGEIELSEVTFRGRRSLLCYVADGTGGITLRFFHFNQAQKEALTRGTRIRCYGTTRLARGGLEMIHPEYRRIFDTVAVEECLTPFYPATEGIQQTRLRFLSEQALAVLDYDDSLKEWLPDAILEKLHLPDLHSSLRYVHRPPPDAKLDELLAGVHPTQQRLAFEELLAQHLALRQLREQARREPAVSIQTEGRLRKQCEAALPFQLTAAQQRVIKEIQNDLSESHPAMRLVQGDVGSGKTLVAALVALDVIEAGYQVALMAPTELLAEQHYRNFCQWFAPLKIKVGWLASKIKAKQKKETLQQLADGQIDIAVGTHALFQEQVQFNKLAFLIVDEQHRFGVHQRLALREKGLLAEQHPHQLIMTATPIPRSLAMTAYADLDYSVIDELPPGRTPVQTVVISDQRRAEVVARIEKACLAGNQVYWVCTLIEESELLQCQAAENTATELAAALSHVRIGLIHGRLKAEQKENLMRRFRDGEIDLLVATTVIEVGVDVPNASLMIIENAERLGLAQLHQLRGRVGRGARHSHCVLMYRAPLNEKARERLDTLRNSHDGFVIARKDLEMRGPGEVLGTRQTGLVDFRIADICRDAQLLPRVHQAAELLNNDCPQAIQPLIDRWLGGRQQYRNV